MELQVVRALSRRTSAYARPMLLRKRGQLTARLLRGRAKTKGRSQPRTTLCDVQAVVRSADGAEYESQGQSAKRSGARRPWIAELKATVALKGRNKYFGFSGLHLFALITPRGDALRACP